MKIAVVGSRNFHDYDLLKKTLTEYEITSIVSGGANGADSLGERYADEHNIPTIIFKPDWKQFGQGAGRIRNKTIVENADFVIAFWDGLSKGTQISIEIAKKLNKPLRVVMVELHSRAATP